jgi:hemerythrin-like domain-containing protein
MDITINMTELVREMRMTPIEQLKAEHEGIKLMLKIMDRVCNRLKSENELNQDHFTKILEFIKIFIDKCHHGKEEDLLIPAMVKAGISKDADSITFMVMEHEEGRGYVKNMIQSFDKLKEGNARASEKIIHNEKNYSDLLVKHIDKEESILYPIAGKVLSLTKQGELLEEFEKLEVDRIGLGKHEEFHKLLHQLKEIYLD